MKLDVSLVIGRLSALPSRSPIKRLLRAPLQFIPPGLRVPVVGGPLQGKRWIVGSSISRCWLGTYDRPESALMKHHLRPGSICFDIGAQAGYHTLYASTVVGPSGRVFAFEPAPRNTANIRKHLAMNHLENVTVVEAAVSDFDGISQFDCASSAVAGRLSPDGGLAVRTITLDGEIERGELPEPDYIKIDAEGAELRILEGARRLLTRRHPTLSIETHQWLPEFPTVRQDCMRFLYQLGYSLKEPDPTDKDSDTHLCALSGLGHPESDGMIGQLTHSDAPFLVNNQYVAEM
jgi:FkbM family methyltransferase